MLNIINPHFMVNENNNIFNLRKKEYENLESKIREILIPAEEAGFSISEFGIRDSYTTYDLEKTLKNHVIIKLQKGDITVDLSCFIPKLIDNNYIMIRGNRKIPMFQLYDLPVVTRGKSIKIRTNVLSIAVIEKDEAPYINIDIMGSTVPLALLYISSFDKNDIEKTFNLNSITLNENPITMYEKFIYDLKCYYDSSIDESITDLYEEIGSFYNTQDPLKKGETVVYGLKIALKTDISSLPFFETGNILNEIVNIIKVGKNIDDKNIENKRLRCFEYMILSKISKWVYDLCLTAKTSRKFKFNVNSMQILSECTVSKIVEYDFSINPISQLTYLSRCSLVGPGGFNKENVPTHLRDIDDSMFGRICPVDTSDRDNCGVLQHVLPNVDLDNNMRFTKNIIEKSPISVAVSMVPFVEHNDQTRLQMAASQMRQAINLDIPDIPYIQSGCEELYTGFSSFIKRARKSGEVVYIDSALLIVLYDDKDYDVFEIENRMTTEGNMDIMNVVVSVGDRVKKGDILSESNFCIDGKVSIGKNLLTAVMPYYGYNYEDAIVISDRLVRENVLTSLHFMDLSFVLPQNKILLSLEQNRYKPLPEPRPNIELDEPGKGENYYSMNKYELIQKGRPYAILKEISDDPSEYFNIFEEKNPMLTKKDVVITGVEIYPNKYNEVIPEFRDWVKEKFESQVNYQEKVKKVIYNFLPKNEALRYIKDNGLDRFSNIGKFKRKEEHINGMLISIKGFYNRPIEEGDKIGNRHGNKGVISRIVPHDKMPQMEDGRHVDICINPLGTISRMNVGQLFELHMGMSLNDLKLNMCKMLDDGNSQKELRKYLLNYMKIVDNTDGWYYKQFSDQIKKIVIDKNFINTLTIIEPPFETTHLEKILEACKYTNTPLEYKIYEPIEDINLINKIGVGYMYFFRMVHIAENKLAARGIGSYTRKTLQPPGGRKNNGGQRCGEMETCCLISHNGITNLFEILGCKSDCIDSKNKYIREKIGSEFIKDIQDEDIVPEGVKLLSSYLKLLGIDI